MSTVGTFLPGMHLPPELLRHHHAAAHAVLQAQLGRSIFSIDVYAQDAAEACANGEFEFWYFHRSELNTRAGRNALLRDCVYQLAGWAVERNMPLWSTRTASERTSLDRGRVSWLIGLLGLDEHEVERSIDHAKSVAQRLVSDRDVIYRIARVSSALRHRGGLLSGEELWDVLRDTDRVVDCSNRLRARKSLPTRLTRSVVDRQRSPMLRPLVLLCHI